jgi:uncharacterized Rossmann fold enzyme
MTRILAAGVVVVTCFPFGITALEQVARGQAPGATAATDPSADDAVISRPWTGDLDGMILANIEINDPNASGVIFAHGSRFGGHSLFIKGRLMAVQ